MKKIIRKLWKGALPPKEAQKRLEKDYVFPADLTNATAATINEIREAFAIQQKLEKDN